MKVIGAFSLCGLLAAALACPIQRPAIPIEYYGFRGDLQGAVTDTALVTMAGDRAMRDLLENRLSELAAYLSVDSLIATLAADGALNPLAGAIETKLNEILSSDGVGGNVRDAFVKPDGQRLAVDAIVIGLGRALHQLSSDTTRSAAGATDGPKRRDGA